MLTDDEIERAQQAFRHAPDCYGAVWAVFDRRDVPMLRCRNCERIVPIATLLVESAGPPLRYALTCVWCDQSIRLASPKPRIPLHPACEVQRRQSRGHGKAMADA